MMGRSVTKKTHSGRLPLHLALETKLPPEVISLLLKGGASKLSKLQPGTVANCHDTIFTRFNGMLVSSKIIKCFFLLSLVNDSYSFSLAKPLHIAVWNDSSPEIIATLLELDPNSINETVHGVFNVEEASVSDAQSRMVTMQTVMKSVHQMNALHLALTHGNTKVIELLLNRESSKARSSVRENTVLARDCKERLPLHIACINSQKNSPVVIKRLLDLDGSKKSTQGLDLENNTPLHYACDDSNANPDTVELLINGEEKFLVLKGWNRGNRREDRLDGRFIESEHLKRASHYLNKDRSSPLFLALQGGAEEKVLEHLLQQEHFFLKGSDALLSDLSKRISKKKSMGSLVIDKLAERAYFFFLLIDVYSHVASLLSFLVAANALLNSTEVFNIDLSVIIILWMCIVIGAGRYVIL